MDQPEAEHPTSDPSCGTAHGQPSARTSAGTLVAVYASPFALHLLRWARDLGYRCVLLEPDPTRVSSEHRDVADEVLTDPSAAAPDAATDVVVTDHHRDDLGPTMAPLVRATPRWIGIMGNPRHPGPHGPALAAEGVADDLIATVHRPIGLDIGSKAPAEIALSTLAGLVAYRNGRAGGPMTAPSAAPAHATDAP